ncbi:hypothetical protein DJ90_5841 [Paenibacillus macerans]|uniref:Uncharacterized protein n=1 Tax=Paenibacillus macerans TaxID=44252 RepID=A0A090Y9W8_PAEMA|nr:hypothetical protein DJ90_5841 [Paenibacillus macerans]
MNVHVLRSPRICRVFRLRTLMINYECDFHLPARFVGTVAHSFCQCGYGAMQHREAPAEHSEHLHLVSFSLPNTSPSEPPKASPAWLPVRPSQTLANPAEISTCLKPPLSDSDTFARNEALALNCFCKPHYPRFLSPNMLNYMHLYVIWQ